MRVSNKTKRILIHEFLLSVIYEHITEKITWGWTGLAYLKISCPYPYIIFGSLNTTLESDFTSAVFLLKIGKKLLLIRRNRMFFY